MNGLLICSGVAGYAGSARGVERAGGLRIEELRFGHTTHLQFICGKTIAQLLAGAKLELDDGTVVTLDGLPQLSIPCRMFEVPYRLTGLFFPEVPSNAQIKT